MVSGLVHRLRELGVARGMGTSALLLALSSAAAAQSIEQTLVDAYDYSPQLRASEALLRATDEGVPQALSNFRPSAEILAERGFSQISGHARTPLQQNFLFGDFSPEAYGLRITQPVYRGGRTLAEESGATNRVMAQRARLYATEQTVLLTAATDFFEVLQDQSALDLCTENERAYGQYLEDTRGRFKGGAITQTDLSQAEAAWQRASAERRTAEGELAMARAVFHRDVGKAPETLAVQNPKLPLPETEDEAISAAETESPNVIAADYAERAARDDVDRETGSLLPSVSLVGSVFYLADIARVGVQPDTLVVGRSRSQEERVVAQLTIPIFDGGKSYSLSRQARQTVSQRASELDAAQRAAHASAASIWEDLHSARSVLGSVEAEVRANEQALVGVADEANLGLRTTLDVLNAQEALFRAKLALVHGHRDVSAKEFALAAALGRLTARRLELPTEIYEPERHFEAVRDKWFGLSAGEDELPRSRLASLTPQPAAAPAPERPLPPEAGAEPRYTRATSVETLPNEKMDFTGEAGLSGEEPAPDDPNSPVSYKAERDRKQRRAATRTKWMEYGSPD